MVLELMTIETVAFGYEADKRLRSHAGQIVMGLVDGSLGPFRHNGHPGELVRTDSSGHEAFTSATPDTFAEMTAEFARSDDRRLFLSMGGEAFGEHTTITIDADTAVPVYAGTGHIPGPLHPAVLDIGIEIDVKRLGFRPVPFEARDAVFDWGATLLQKLAALRDPVVGRVTSGTGTTWWERQHKGPVRPRPMYYWESHAKILSPDWCLLLNDSHIDLLGAAELRRKAHSVEALLVPSGQLHLVQATEKLSDIAQDEGFQQSWIEFLQPILW